MKLEIKSIENIKMYNKNTGALVCEIDMDKKDIAIDIMKSDIDGYKQDLNTALQIINDLIAENNHLKEVVKVYQELEAEEIGVKK